MFSCTMYIVEVTGVDRSVDESETTPVSSSTRLFQNLVSFCAFHVVCYVSQLYVVITNNAFHWDEENGCKNRYKSDSWLVDAAT